MLDEEELAILLRVCRDHEVFHCLTCQKSYQLSELSSDLITGRRFHQCPSCRQSTDDWLRVHLVDCPVVRAEVLDGRADVIMKVTMTLIDRSRVRIAESRDRIQRNLGRPTSS